MSHAGISSRILSVAENSASEQLVVKGAAALLLASQIASPCVTNRLPRVRVAQRVTLRMSLT